MTKKPARKVDSATALPRAPVHLNPTSVQSQQAPNTRPSYVRTVSTFSGVSLVVVCLRPPETSGTSTTSTTSASSPLAYGFVIRGQQGPAMSVASTRFFTPCRSDQEAVAWLDASLTLHPMLVRSRGRLLGLTPHLLPSHRMVLLPPPSGGPMSLLGRESHSRRLSCCCEEGPQCVGMNDKPNPTPPTVRHPTRTYARNICTHASSRMHNRLPTCTQASSRMHNRHTHNRRHILKER